MAEVRHVTRASDTDIRRAAWDAIMVGGMPYVIIRAAQYTPALEASADTARDDSSAPSIGDDALVDSAPFDDDSGDQLQSDTADDTTADDTTDEASDDAYGSDPELPELVSVSALQVSWEPLAGRFVTPHDCTSRTHTQRTVSHSLARLPSFTHDCAYDRTYLTRSVLLPPRGAIVQVVEEATQMHLRQARGWVRAWIPSTGRLHLALAQQSGQGDAKHMRGHLDARAAHAADVMRGAWQEEQHAWPHTRTHEGHGQRITHEAAVWPAEVQQTVDGMATWHDMEHVHEHDHAQHHETQQAQDQAALAAQGGAPSCTTTCASTTCATAERHLGEVHLDDDGQELEQEHEEQEHEEHQHCHAPAARATRDVNTHQAACTRGPRASPSPSAASSHFSLFTGKFAPRIASLGKNLEITWERWGRPLGQNIKAVIQRMTAPLPAHPPRPASPPPVGGGVGSEARPALPAHPPRSASPPPVGGGVGSEARPAPRPTPRPGSPSVPHTLVASHQRESNAGSVEIPMMAQPIDSAVASLPAVMLSSTSYRASPDAD